MESGGILPAMETLFTGGEPEPDDAVPASAPLAARLRPTGLEAFVGQAHLPLIGATTENPSFEVNRALLSRCRVYELEALTPQEVRTLLERAARDAEPAALELLAERSGGDARVALSALEIAREPVTVAEAEEA